MKITTYRGMLIVQNLHNRKIPVTRMKITTYRGMLICIKSSGEKKFPSPVWKLPPTVVCSFVQNLQEGKIPVARMKISTYRGMLICAKSS